MKVDHAQVVTCDNRRSLPFILRYPAGDGTAHGHGFVALANIYQYSALEDISAALESDVHGAPPAGTANRATSFT